MDRSPKSTVDAWPSAMNSATTPSVKLIWARRYAVLQLIASASTISTSAVACTLTSSSLPAAPLSPSLAAKILEEFARSAAGARAAPDVGKVAELTPRQMEVLTLVAQGLTYKEVGEALCLSERTVKYHISEILRKLDVSGRTEAVVEAARSGIIAL